MRTEPPLVAALSSPVVSFGTRTVRSPPELDTEMPRFAPTSSAVTSPPEVWAAILPSIVARMSPPDVFSSRIAADAAGDDVAARRARHRRCRRCRRDGCSRRKSSRRDRRSSRTTSMSPPDVLRRVWPSTCSARTSPPEVRHVHGSVDVGEADVAAGGSAASVAIELPDCDVAAGGADVDVVVARHLHFDPAVEIPAAQPVRPLAGAVLRDDRDVVAALFGGQRHALQRALRAGDQDVHHDLVARSAFDAQVAAVRLDRQPAAGCDAEGSVEPFLGRLGGEGAGNEADPQCVDKRALTKRTDMEIPLWRDVLPSGTLTRPERLQRGHFPVRHHEDWP